MTLITLKVATLTGRVHYQFDDEYTRCGKRIRDTWDKNVQDNKVSCRQCESMVQRANDAWQRPQRGGSQDE